MDVPPFPLLHLPKNALMKALQNMKKLEQLSISFCSKKCINLIKTLNQKPVNFCLSLENNIQMLVKSDGEWFLEFDFHEAIWDNYLFNVERPTDLPVINHVTASYFSIPLQNQGQVICEKPEFKIRDWIDHLMEVFNCSNIELGYESERYHIPTICDTLQGIEIETLYIDTTDSAYSQSIKKNFMPTKRLSLYQNPFAESNSVLVHEYLIEYLDHLRLSIWFPVTLSDLLVINSSNVEVYDPMLSDRELNRFVKHWINGSNPRLKYICIQFSFRIINDYESFVAKVLSGVQYHIVPDEQERVFHKSNVDFNQQKTVIIKGGYDIQRSDGTNATILLKPIGDVMNIHSNFIMAIWN